MLDPPPSPLPIDIGISRPFKWGLGCAWNPQSRSLPRLVGHRAGLRTESDSSLPPASSSRTWASAFSASRRAITDPEEPAPHTMKS